MQCGKCNTILPTGQTKCPVCGTLNAPETTRATLPQSRYPERSKGVALFVAWIGWGILLWKYLGDDDRFKERLHEFGHLLLWAALIIGLPRYLIVVYKWYFGDIWGILAGTLRYSDGSRVWR